MPQQVYPNLQPLSCDVLVVGAGPAGSACAQLLAAAGRSVLLVDQHDFPRDKVCGDGLIPDSHAALHRLGVADEVASLATPVQHVRCVGPRGGQVDVPGTLSVLPRKVLDDVLVRSAQRAGARLLTPWRFEAPLEEGGRVVGARFQRLARRAGVEHSTAGSDIGGLVEHGADASLDILARWVVLATGAVPQALQAVGLCERHTPSGVALRAYVKCDRLVGRMTQLHMVWHPRLRGGYGWIFPAPGGVFNIGAGLTGSHIRQRDGKGRMHDVNLRGMFDAFCELYAPARELMLTGTMQGAVKGAPLRCSLLGARWSRPGLLVTGEAAGSTYAFSGEGIGKAMETGMLAAEALCRAAWCDDDATRRAYEQALVQLKPRFDLYETASRVNHHPWLADLVLWRARRSARIRNRLSQMLEERQNPGRLFTLRGVAKLMLE
jgi:menaquinone-9 beta-reductase